MSIMNDDERLMSRVNKRSRYMLWHDKKMQSGSVDNNRQPFRSLRFPLKLVLAEKRDTGIHQHLRMTVVYDENNNDLFMDN